MKIYFACAITGGRKDESNYQAIVAGLQTAGHEVLTAGLASSEVILLEATAGPVKVYERDTAWIRESNCLIAEVSTPSHGVGYEYGYALSQGKPVVCIHREGRTVSKMILGNRDKALSIFPYTEIEDVLETLYRWLDEIQNS